MWYITIDLRQVQSKSGVGGLGHTMCDLLTPIIIGMAFNIKYIIPTLITKTDKNDEVKWNDIINLTTSIDNDISNYKTVRINLVKPFTSLSFTELSEYFSKYDRNKDIVFYVANNNRIYLNEIYHHDKSTYQKLINHLRNQCVYQPITSNNNIVMHIRRGDWSPDLIEYYINIYNQFSKISNDYIYTIVAYGTHKQLSKIKNAFKGCKIKYLFNINNVSTFKTMINAEILVCGHSSFSKIIGIYNPNIKIYVPFVDGITKPLISFGKRNYLGNMIEEYGQDWIMADAYGNFNIQMLQ